MIGVARRIPEDADGVNASEKQVFDELCLQLPEEATVLPNLRFTDREADREADAVVVWPGVGVAVIEIRAPSSSTPAGPGTSTVGERRRRSDLSNRP